MKDFEIMDELNNGISEITDSDAAMFKVKKLLGKMKNDERIHDFSMVREETNLLEVSIKRSKSSSDRFGFYLYLNKGVIHV